MYAQNTITNNKTEKAPKLLNNKLDGDDTLEVHKLMQLSLSEMIPYQVLVMLRTEPEISWTKYLKHISEMTVPTPTSYNNIKLDIIKVRNLYYRNLTKVGINNTDLAKDMSWELPDLKTRMIKFYTYFYSICYHLVELKKEFETAKAKALTDNTDIGNNYVGMVESLLRFPYILIGRFLLPRATNPKTHNELVLALSLLEKNITGPMDCAIVDNIMTCGNRLTLSFHYLNTFTSSSHVVSSEKYLLDKPVAFAQMAMIMCCRVMTTNIARILSNGKYGRYLISTYDLSNGTTEHKGFDKYKASLDLDNLPVNHILLKFQSYIRYFVTKDMKTFNDSFGNIKWSFPSLLIPEAEYQIESHNNKILNTLMTNNINGIVKYGEGLEEKMDILDTSESNHREDMELVAVKNGQQLFDMNSRKLTIDLAKILSKILKEGTYNIRNNLVENNIQSKDYLTEGGGDLVPTKVEITLFMLGYKSINSSNISEVSTLLLSDESYLTRVYDNSSKSFAITLYDSQGNIIM